MAMLRGNSDSISRLRRDFCGNHLSFHILISTRMQGGHHSLLTLSTDSLLLKCDYIEGTHSVMYYSTKKALKHLQHCLVSLTTAGRLNEKEL